MIHIKTPQEIEEMKEGGVILGLVIKKLAEEVCSGMSTKEVDKLAHDLVIQHGTKPAFLGYKVGGVPYPATICISVNDEIVHGLPTDKILKDGDVVGMDMGLVHKKWNLDSAVTVIIGNSGNEKSRKLVDVTRDAMYIGIEKAIPGNHVGDIGHAVQKYVESHGFGVVRDLVGHGIGRKLHEEPRIPNYGSAGEGPILREGMVVAIEPMVTGGDWRVVISDDGWTYKTKDGSMSAHFEHTVAITKDGPVVLTKQV